MGPRALKTYKMAWFKEVNNSNGISQKLENYNGMNPKNPKKNEVDVYPSVVSLPAPPSPAASTGAFASAPLYPAVGAP